MVELHGWANIRESYFMFDDDTDEDHLEQIVEEIKLKILGLQWQSGLADLRVVNDHYHLSINIFTNHRDGRIDDVFRLYEFIADIAPGSYGLMYVYDDEDKQGRDNEFLVYVLAKGKLTENKDQYLSPYITTVEELR